MVKNVLDPIATGARIKELRIKNNLTVAKICDYVGLCSEQAVYKWQRGESIPTVDNLVLLSQMLNVPLDDLVQRKQIDEGFER